MDKRTWALEDHLCKYCGGRVLRCVSGNGATPGGSPIYKCSLCGVVKSGIHPDVICWCGFSHRMNHNSTAYVCQSFDVIEDRPELEEAFRACGCNPNWGEVGILLESDFRRIRKEVSGQ